MHFCLRGEYLDLGRSSRRLQNLHNEELHNFHSSPNVTTALKSKMRWVGHAACMGKMRNANILVEKL